MIEKIKDADLFIVTHLGPHFKEEIENAGIKYKIVKENLITELLAEYLC